MKKYRIRLDSGRVIGPFVKEQFAELKSKGHIKGHEECQEYPTGSWEKLNTFVKLNELVSKTVSSSPIVKEENEATFVRKLSDFQNIEDIPDDPEKNTNVTVNGNFPKEFKFDMSEQTQITTAAESPEEEETTNTKTEDEPAPEELTKTVTEQKPSKKEKMEQKPTEDEDKTLVNLDTVKYLEELKKQKEELDEQEKKDKILEEQVEPNRIDLNSDATQFISLTSLKEEVIAETIDVEKELVKEEKKYNKEIALEKQRVKKAVAKRVAEQEEEEEDSEEEGKQKKKKIIIIAAIAALLVFLFPAEVEKKVVKFQPVYPRINFPQQFEKPNKKVAIKLYQSGVKLLNKQTYKSKVKAAIKFRESSENLFKKNPATAKMIFLYSDLLKNSKDKVMEGNKIFKLVQIFKSKAIKDPLFANAISLFYLNSGKASAALRVAEKFNAIKKNKPSLELFSTYLRSLIETGNFEKASKVAKKLRAAKSNNLYVNIGLIDYYLRVNDFTEASNVIVHAIDSYPDSVSLLIRKLRLLVYLEDFKGMVSVLKRIKKHNSENSHIFHAKYLEYSAIYSVSNGQIPQAIKLFKKALKLNESSELRSRLAGLSQSENMEANNLIIESKAIKHMSDSRNQLKEKNWKFAFKDALKATSVAPDYVPAKIYLASLQTKQSFFTEAIATLEGLYVKMPNDPVVIFALINVYIESYKFSDVKRMLNLLATTDLNTDPRYYANTAKYYVFKDDFAYSLSWLRKAINKNPLNDENIYSLAKLLIRYRKYKMAKLQLNKAMDLDPTNINYRVSYAEILYEVENANTAIGYLYDILQDFPDNPKLLSAIGIYYYKSGQSKSFNNIKKLLVKLPQRDTSLFEFLIKAAQLDDKLDLVVEYSQKLIELNPGDLKTRLFLGKIYIEMTEYKKALKQFKAIERRLPTSPKLQYYMSKLYLLTDDFDKSAELAEKEIKANPGSEDGYVLLGDILSKKKEYSKAEKQYKKAQKINTNNVDMLIGLARINFKKSQYEMSLDLFEKARKQAPDRAEIHKLLGDAYRKTSQSTLAMESYKMFLELSPNSKYKVEINTYIKTMQ